MMLCNLHPVIRTKAGRTVFEPIGEAAAKALSKMTPEEAETLLDGLWVKHTKQVWNGSWQDASYSPKDGPWVDGLVQEICEDGDSILLETDEPEHRVSRDKYRIILPQSVG